MGTITYTALREIDQTWSLIQQLGTQTYVFSLVSLGSGVVLAGTHPTGQIYRSTDSGVTWSLIQRLGTETHAYSLVSLGSGVVLAGTAETGQIYQLARSYGYDYDLEFYTERVDRSVKVIRNQQQPMGGGAPEVLTYRRETYVDVVILGPLGALITETQMLQWREFLASVEGGEVFTFDRYGTIAAPVEAKSAMLASEDYFDERIAGVGGAGLYKLSFKVRLLS